MAKKYWDQLFLLVFCCLGAGVGYYVLPSVWELLHAHLSWLNYGLVNMCIGALIFFILLIILKPLYDRAYDRLFSQKENLSIGRFLLYALGIWLGLIFSWLISIPLVALHWPVISNILPVLLTIVFGALGFFVMHAKMDDLIHFFREIVQVRRQRPKENTQVESTQLPPVAAEKGAPDKILDTSVIIDGRILDILKTGFLEGRLIVPDFVLRELQYIADSSASHKRVRGRRGLDMLNEMKELPDVEVEFYRGDFPEEEDVDLKLLLLARKLGGVVVTNDYNLNKVSHFHKIKVLNINELANAVKAIVVPGDQLAVKLIKPGTERMQGVGYLNDGTMIVVEDGYLHLDEIVDIEVTSAIQTNAGKMIFGVLL